MSKRGISPVIATVLLVLIAIIIAVIIFLWARSFIGEQTLKFDQAISLSCDKVSFEAEAFVSTDPAKSNIYIVNNGNVPIYGVEISKKGLGSVSKVGTLGNQKTISNGESGTIPLEDANLAVGDEITVTPILIGQQGETKKAYTCTDATSVQTVTVQAGT